MADKQIVLQHVDTGERLSLDIDSRVMFMWEKTGRGRSVTQLHPKASNPYPVMLGTYELALIAAKRDDVVPRDVSLDEFAATYVVPSDASADVRNVLGEVAETSADPDDDEPEGNERDPFNPARADD